MKNLLLLSLCCLLIVSGSASGGSLDETLQKMAGSAVQGYVSPIVTAFGTDLNGGWFHRAPAAEMYGFDLEFGLVAMGASMKNANTTIPGGVGGQFTFDDQQSAQIAQSIPNWNLIPGAQQQAIINKIATTPFNVQLTGPTIVGSKDDFVQVKFPGQTITVNGQSFTIPDNVINTSVTGYLGTISTIPLAAPQLSIGTLVGTQLTFRWLPSYNNADYGKLKYFGFGIQHNPGIWFPQPLPVNLCLSFFTQSLDAGSIFTTKTTAFGINASKTFGPGALNITPYAGFMLESSKMTFSYTSTLTLPNNAGTQLINVNLPLTGDDKSRLTVGLSIKILFLDINADYNIGKYNSETAGLMFII
ncbi:MAG TPA: DUF6588 family protein [Bacteroidota bacterium]|nr:DUF6588 family protein [Bacteroidota bacterium]